LVLDDLPRLFLVALVELRALETPERVLDDHSGGLVDVLFIE